MYEGVKVLLNLNSSIWATNTAVSTCVTAFNGYITAINTNNTAQKTSTKGTTQTKQIARLKMIQAALAIASAGKAYATVTKDLILFGKCNYTKTKIIRYADVEVGSVCQNIHNAIAPYIGSTSSYGASPASLANLQSLITNYTSLLGSTAVKKSVVTAATLTLNQTFTAITALLKYQLDPLMEQYKTTNPTFYTQYKVARRINDIGYGHGGKGK